MYIFDLCPFSVGHPNLTMQGRQCRASKQSFKQNYNTFISVDSGCFSSGLFVKRMSS